MKKIEISQHSTYLSYVIVLLLVTLVLSAVRIPLRDLALVFGLARSAVRLLLVVLSPSLLLLPSLSDPLFRDFVVPSLRLKDEDDWYPLFTFHFC